MPAPCNWDVDPGELGVCSGWGDHAEPVQEAALELASTFLWAATGRQYGPCSVTVRPCHDRFEDPAYRSYAAWPGQDPAMSAPFPILDGGVWRNCGCGPRCCCRPKCAVALRGPVAGVLEVTVDGETISPEDYRVDVAEGTYWLVRLDGMCWPTCQDFESGPSAEGAFTVSYERGRELPKALELATAILACEYAKSMTGGECRLPARMTQLNRQGVTVEVEPASPEEGQTGITEVDAIVHALAAEQVAPGGRGDLVGRQVVYGRPHAIDTGIGNHNI
jgi:hypothetical protein